jgi:hypothetical protein
MGINVTMFTEDQITKQIDKLIAKGDKVIATYQDSTSKSWGKIDFSAFAEWKSQTLNFVVNLLGREHEYYQNVKKEIEKETTGMYAAYGDKEIVEKVKGILRAIKEDALDGFLLTNIRTLISAEIFTDFLEMVEHLLGNKYKDAAATLCGAVLEDGLRRIALKAGIKKKNKDDLNSLNQKCADKNVYNRLRQKEIQVWIDIRNNASHGKFEEYSEEDVKKMHKGVSSFLTNYL